MGFIRRMKKLKLQVAVSPHSDFFRKDDEEDGGASEFLVLSNETCIYISRVWLWEIKKSVSRAPHKRDFGLKTKHLSNT